MQNYLDRLLNWTPASVEVVAHGVRKQMRMEIKRRRRGKRERKRRENRRRSRRVEEVEG